MTVWMVTYDSKWFNDVNGVWNSLEKAKNNIRNFCNGMRYTDLEFFEYPDEEAVDFRFMDGSRHITGTIEPCEINSTVC